MFLSTDMQAVMIIACEKHAPRIVESLATEERGNWLVMPAVEACRLGYWPNVSGSRDAAGKAILGFIERQELTRKLEEWTATNSDGSLCLDCVAYEWSITPLRVAARVRDVVCGKVVACSNALPHPHEGELFFFCSVGCRDAFTASPRKFVRTPPREERTETHASST